jgi:hypothetical protein
MLYDILKLLNITNIDLTSNDMEIILRLAFLQVFTILNNDEGFNLANTTGKYENLVP